MTTFQLLMYVDKRYSLVTNVCLSMITVFPVRCPLVNSVCPQRVCKRRVSIKASYWQYTDTCKTSFLAQPPILPLVTALETPAVREVAYVKGLWLIFYFTDCHWQSYRQWLVRIFNSWYHNKNHTASDCSCLSTGPARWDLADDRLLCHERQCDCKRELWTQFGQTTGMFQLNCCKLTLTYGERAR